MSFLIPERRFDPRVFEMIDLPDNDPDILWDDLKNLRTINKFFGGISSVRSQLRTLLEKMDNKNEVEILDLATGSADHPIAIAEMMKRLQRNYRIVAVDNNPPILEVARNRVSHLPEIQIEGHDILDLPYPEDSFDIVLCSLAIHHFSESDVVRILAAMHRISRMGFIVNDLNRTWPGAWTAWLFTHATSRNPMTLHDSYLSVLRGFTPSELRDLALEAGLRRFQIKTRPFFRLILVGES